MLTRQPTRSLISRCGLIQQELLNLPHLSLCQGDALKLVDVVAIELFTKVVPESLLRRQIRTVCPLRYARNKLLNQQVFHFRFKHFLSLFFFVFKETFRVNSLAAFRLGTQFSQCLSLIREVLWTLISAGSVPLIFGEKSWDKS